MLRNIHRFRNVTSLMIRKELQWNINKFVRLSKTSDTAIHRKSYMGCKYQCMYRSFSSSFHTSTRAESKDSSIERGFTTTSTNCRHLDETLLSQLEGETQYSSQYIDKVLKDDRIDRRIIEKEIHEAASRVGSSIPEEGPTGEYIYYFNDDLNSGQRSYYRKSKKHSMLLYNQEQKVFDVNLHFEYLGPMSLSIDEKFVARLITYIDTGMKAKVVVTDINSGLEYTMRGSFADPRFSKMVNVEFGPKFKCNNVEYHSIFATTCDDVGRPSAVHVCTFNGTSFGPMKCVLEDKVASNFVDVQRTKGCEYVAINSTSKTDNEVHIIGGGYSGVDFDDKSIPWLPILIKKRENDVQYYVDCGNKGDVIILAHQFLNQANDHPNTNCEQRAGSGLGPEISVYEEQVENLPLSSNQLGRPIHIHSDELEFFVEDMDLFEDYLALYERSSINSNQRIRILDRDKNCHDIVTLPDQHHINNHMISPGGNMHFNANSLNFCSESPLTPPLAWTYNFEKKSFSTSTKYVEEKFESERVTTIANDGTSIPLSLYFNNSVRSRGVILIGYGSYGQNIDLRYDPALSPLVNRGFVIAFCHGRGGGDLGKKWYQAGRLYNKKNAINDYLECAKALSSGKVPIPNFHAAHGDDNSEDCKPSSLFLASKSFSAGGVVVGGAINDSLSSSSLSSSSFPNIFSAVSLTNPFLDVMGTMMKENNGDHFLTEHEYDEFGDPISDKRARSAISSYCPLLNIQDIQPYPPMIVFCSIDDENVPMLANSVRYVMKVRDAMSKGRECNNNSSRSSRAEPNENDILLHVEKEGGHHLHGRRVDVCTLEACFLLGQLYKSLK